MSNVELDQLYEQHLRTMTQRAERALAATGFDALVISAGVSPVLFLDDQDYPYKVNPHFKAWVPIIDNPRCLLVYAPGKRPRVLFYRPNDYWHQAASLPRDAWTKGVELESMTDPGKARAAWADLGRVACIGPESAFPDAPEGTVNEPELLRHLHYERAVKTGYEIECLRRASDLGARGHVGALAAFRRGASEYEAHMQYLTACVQREEEMPYNNIVAYNEHAAVLHYQNLDRQAPAALHSFLIDAGAQFRGYAADITRTYSASPGLFSDLIHAVNAAQQALCEEIVVGRDYREVHMSAHRILGEVLHQVGITKLSGQAALEQRLTGIFFPHGIGHLLGLQVHDVGGVMGDVEGGERKRPEGHPYLRLTRMLEPGVVVTVEPGIYFIDLLLAQAHADERRAHIDWTVVERLKPFGGVRIEDNVVAAAGGPENLTRAAFAKLAA